MFSHNKIKHFNDKHLWFYMCGENTADNIVCSKEGDQVLVEKKDGRESCYKRIIHILDGRPFTSYPVRTSVVNLRSKRNSKNKKKNFGNGEVLETFITLTTYKKVTYKTEQFKSITVKVKTKNSNGKLKNRTAIFADIKDRRIKARTDLLYQIYEETGYEPSAMKKVRKKNDKAEKDEIKNAYIIRLDG